MNYNFDIKDLAATAAVLTFIKVVFEYIKSQKWKRAEFLTKEVKEFYDDSDIKNVLLLLDWNEKKIKVDNKDISVNDELLKTALITHNKNDIFTEDQSSIRYLFDRFFDELSRFNLHIESGLVREVDVYRYFNYYVNILHKVGRKDEALVKVFTDYISYYDFENISSLIERFKKIEKLKQTRLGRIQIKLWH